MYPPVIACVMCVARYRANFKSYLIAFLSIAHWIIRENTLFSHSPTGPGFVGIRPPYRTFLLGTPYAAYLASISNKSCPYSDTGTVRQRGTP